MAKFGLQFNGTTSFAQCSFAPSTTTFSISFWYNPQGWTSNARIVDKNDAGPVNGFNIIQQTVTNKLNFNIHDATGLKASTTFGILPLNVWSHLVATFDSSSGNTFTYTNGLQTDTQSGAATASSAATLTFGRLATASSNFSKTSLRELRFYNRVLSLSEVKQLYSGVVPSGAAAEYLFRDARGGTTAADTAGTNNMTLTAPTFLYTASPAIYHTSIGIGI